MRRGAELRARAFAGEGESRLCVNYRLFARLATSKLAAMKIRDKHQTECRCKQHQVNTTVWSYWSNKEKTCHTMKTTSSEHNMTWNDEPADAATLNLQPANEAYHSQCVSRAQIRQRMAAVPQDVRSVPVSAVFSSGQVRSRP